MDPGDPAGDPAAGERCRTGQDPLLLLQALQTLWSTRERQQLREEAWRGFAALDDPLAGLLDMLESCRGRRGEGPSLEAWISHQLQCWLQAQPRPSPAQHSLRLKQLQARAVRVLTESPTSLVAPLASIFQLQDADRSCLLVHVHRLHHEGRFREAVMLGTTLKLQPELDVEKMSIPLLLQDKVALVERYVAGFPDLQRRLLALMDSWCQPGFDIKDVARQYPEVTSLSLEKLSPKVLSRQVLRLQERYGVALALCPNAAIQRRLAALRHLCHKRFVEKSLSQENWTDHVQGLVGQSPWLQEQLSQLLVSHGDTVTAAQCAMDLSLPEERLPAAVAVELRRLRLQGRATEADLRLEVKDMKDHYYQLPIPRENIHLLASWEDLTRHEGALLQCHQVVGVDLEWTPVFVAGGRPRPSLLQVAVEGHVFLLDVLALSQPPTGQGAQAFSQLVAQLLSDPSITKLGYGMVGDLQKLGTSCPALAHVEKQILGGMDLLLVHRQMRVANMPAPGVDRARELRGLSLLVQQVLGTALDKTQQLSNWDRRPLCEEQLLYAAADAYCLLEVHQALCREPARFHLSEELAGSRRPRHRERPGAQKPPGLQKASAPAAPRQVPVAVAVAEGAAPQVPARAFRVVCDNMLQGLARSLRCLGVDARMLGNGEDHRRAAEVARQEGRIILTSGQPFHKLRAQVGAGRCLSVDCSLKAHQQAKAVLKHFNVRVTHADIFSRCQACNCDQYLKVSRDMMKQLMWLSGHQEGPRSSGDEATQSQEVQEPGPAPDAASEGCTYDRPCHWLQTADLRAETPDMLANGTRLQLAGVPVGVLRTPGLRYFYCCTRCGKVFWDGSHLGRVATHFRDVLESAPSPCEPSPAPSPASSPF
ncbi:exonuclease mut-7 homolog isoform X8 [Pongo pygmaeus]|uniref:exonuclease mut-7 homolog isoform X8 n=1 Tax=Pongo pygmaeus TaxID=9600 RepID=UPI0023E2A35B|nr:exonuclease mut-7 homolog isoform X7 [Pongo pygmaeus]XP_054356269.1 exonuclease mut-7 homolog isoform X7 [Pongo pygmaeus]